MLSLVRSEPVGTSAGGWEQTLVARMAAGDERALQEAYDQYAPLVFGITRRVIGDPASAADATQDVFVGLWQRPESFDASRGSLRSYLAVVARRRAVDHVRRRGRAARLDERLAATASVAPPNVEEAATALVLGEKVRRAVDGLPADQRAAVDLAYFRGLTFVEVAERLGIPEGTAKSRLRLALARLAAALRDEVPMPDPER